MTSSIYTNFLSHKVTRWGLVKDIATIIPIVGIWTGFQKLNTIEGKLDPSGKVILRFSGVLEIFGLGIIPRAVDLFLLTCTNLRV